ncbi:heavy metal translocating P-type ATPase [Maribacter sp. LLG6340-A2]|uniref:heavy metal translocating P-type ATPase n=1 Tax=Maribacter sp. LLG6340-A2 TaxID=3160834 RepID=UPI00386DA9A0
MMKKNLAKQKASPQPQGTCAHCSGNDETTEATKKTTNYRIYLPAIISLTMLMIGLTLDYFKVLPFFKNYIRLAWYIAAYLPVGLPVLKEGWQSIKKGNFFTEFFLMGIATIGAFAIGEYPEGVAVMVFYGVGELFQSAAVKRARGNIKALLDLRPDHALVFRDHSYITVAPEQVQIGEKIQVRAGEKVPLDGALISEKGSFNTAALTGESKPISLKKGDPIYAGSINTSGVIEITTTKAFKDSSIARILDMVQNATARKSKTELFIRKFAKVYTPIVTYLAIALTFLPYFFVADYIFQDWLYRALIFLVISCPCALVISIPLGYFGGLGAASRNGILFKGASFLDTMTKVNTVALDKTGTLTKGVFKIKDLIIDQHFTESEFMSYLTAIEAQSTHPIAKAILVHATDKSAYSATEVLEIAGKGLKGKVNGKTVLAGNKSLMNSNQIKVPTEIDSILESVVMLAIDGKFAGYVTIADELKEDALTAISNMRKAGVKKIIMLSGDKDSITQKVAKELGLDWAKGGLLPEEKLVEVEQLKKQPDTKIAFVGDGINDAPVLATSDVGIAMGGLGSDVAIETADIIIQNDQPTKIATAIKIGNSTRKIVWQNIVLAFGIKLIVLAMGAGGMATMWEAVFADVGVALLAILNAVRLQKMQWD